MVVLFCLAVIAACLAFLCVFVGMKVMVCVVAVVACLAASINLLGNEATLFLVAMVILCAWLLLVSFFIEVIDGKGYTYRHWHLWLIGLFLSPLAIGLFAASLPNRCNTDRACTDNDDSNKEVDIVQR